MLCFYPNYVTFVAKRQGSPNCRLSRIPSRKVDSFIYIGSYNPRKFQHTPRSHARQSPQANYERTPFIILLVKGLGVCSKRWVETTLDTYKWGILGLITFKNSLANHFLLTPWDIIQFLRPFKTAKEKSLQSTIAAVFPMFFNLATYRLSLLPHTTARLQTC